ncbi:MAG: MFS transporter [Acidimicrobiia bacterium]|nr:MFS transporter [Acidimicrobiia bacterium]
MNQRAKTRTFFTVWAGQLVSQVGSSMTGFALTIFVYQESGSVTRLAMVLLAVSLPGLLLGPVAGAWTDRVNRRLVMILGDGVAGLGTMVLAALFLTDNLAYWHIVTTAAVMSAGQAFQEPAYRAALPTLVPKEQLGRANGLVELGPAIGTLVAPAIAGGLLLVFGIGVVLAVDVITFLLAVGTLLFVRFPDVASATRERTGVWKEFLEGWNWLRARRGLFGLLWVFAGVNLVLTLANVLWVPVFLTFTDEAALGRVMSGVGLSMVAGSIAMGAWGGPKKRIAGILGFIALGGVGLVVAGLKPSIVLASAGAFLLMFMVPIVNGTGQALWQSKVELDLQGRVFSARRMIATIATPIAFVSAGPLADRVFEPLLADDGAWATTLGRVFETGPGRGSALLVSFVGVALVLLAASAWLVPAIRHIERDVPDVPQLEDMAEGDPTGESDVGRPAPISQPAAAGD